MTRKTANCQSAAFGIVLLVALLADWLLSGPLLLGAAILFALVALAGWLVCISREGAGEEVEVLDEIEEAQAGLYGKQVQDVLCDPDEDPVVRLVLQAVLLVPEEERAVVAARLREMRKRKAALDGDTSKTAGGPQTINNHLYYGGAEEKCQV